MQGYEVLILLFVLIILGDHRFELDC